MCLLRATSAIRPKRVHPLGRLVIAGTRIVEDVTFQTARVVVEPVPRVRNLSQINR